MLMRWVATAYYNDPKFGGGGAAGVLRELPGRSQRGERLGGCIALIRRSRRRWSDTDHELEDHDRGLSFDLVTLIDGAAR